MKKLLAIILTLCMVLPVLSCSLTSHAEDGEIDYTLNSSITAKSILTNSSRNVLTNIIPSFKRYGTSYQWATAFSGGADSSNAARVAAGELTDGIALGNNNHIDVSYSLSSGNNLFILFELSSATDVQSFLMAGGNWTGTNSVQEYKVFLSSSVTGSSLFSQSPAIHFTNTNSADATAAQEFVFKTVQSVRYVGIQIIDPTANSTDEVARISEIGLYTPSTCVTVDYKGIEKSSVVYSAAAGSFCLTTDDSLVQNGVNYEFVAWYKDGVQISTDSTVTVTITQSETYVARYKESALDQSYIETYGNLSVSGQNLVDKNGNPVQLRGISSHGVCWYPQYINYESFKTLKDWGANFVRLIMITDPSNGYNPSDVAIIKQGIDIASSLGMYALVDWHVLNEGDPNIYKDNAKSFFASILNEYKDYNNVLYEICNEPNENTLSYQVTWNEYIKPYAEEMISYIRTYDSDCVIIVGTPYWSQRVDDAAANPITDQTNIMYTLHFYAGTHQQSLRDTLTAAYNAGLPMFVTEFGICNADSSGAYNYEQGEAWLKLLDSLKISYSYWTLNNNSTGESSAIINKSCSKTSNWTDSDLTDGGIWIKNVLQRRLANSDVSSTVVSENLTASQIAESNSKNVLSGIVPTITQGSANYISATYTVSNPAVTSGRLTDGISQYGDSHVDVTSGLSNSSHLFIYFELPSATRIDSLLMASGNWLGAYNTQEYKIYVSDNLSGYHLFASNPVVHFTNSNDANASGSQLFQLNKVLNVKYIGIEIIDPSANNDDSMSRISEIALYSTNKYNVTVSKYRNGVLSTDKSLCSAGESVLVTATPNTGYSLMVNSILANTTAVNVLNQEDTTGSVFEFRMPAEDVNITSEFADKNAENIAALGAQIRLDSPAGLRFVTRMYNTNTVLVNGEACNIVEYGTLVCPSDILNGQALTCETVNASKCAAYSLFSDNSEYKEFTVVLTGISESNKTRLISIRSYIKYQKSNGTIGYTYSNLIERSWSQVESLIN